MKNVLRIFKRDLKSINKNPITLLIVLGVCFLPSLYAWINIAACWNPYENTSTVPIAVVNNDKEVSVKGKKINVGSEVITELKKNDVLDWKFVNSKDANMGVVNGTYYAMIEIPEDFSKNLTSILDKDVPTKPTITYKVNTKSNPVAGKITGVAKNEIVNNITSNFIDTVNKTVFSSLNNAGKKADSNKDSLLKLKKGIIELNNNMSLVNNVLESVSNHATNLNQFTADLKKSMPLMSNGLKGIEQQSINTKGLITNIQNDLNKSFDNTQLILNQIQSENSRTKNLIATLNNSNGDTILSTSNNIIFETSTGIDSIIGSITSLVDYLQHINKLDKNISDMIVSLNKIKSSLTEEKKHLNDLQSNISTTNGLSKNTLNSINNYANDVQNQISNTMRMYTSNVKPALNNVTNGLVNSTESASSILKCSEGVFTQIDNILNSSATGSKLTADTAKNLNSKLQEFKGLIGKLSTELKKVDDTDLSKIVSILQSKPELVGGFVAKPFNLKEESIYKIENYGSGMAPIYTTLSLWVGALILTSLFKTDIAEFEGSENITLKEQYFGKMMFFTFIAMVQGFIVALGDKVLLGVQTSNVLLLLSLSIVSSFTFSVIVYTLVSLLRNVGKALAIILLVIQIAGCGGSYPIQVDPLFFRILQPLFPFTYAVNGFREAVAGPLASKVLVDFLALFAFAIIFILLGYFLKTPLHPLVDKFETKFEESGISE